MNTAIVRNVSVNIAAQIITAIAGFILPPLIIQTYGSVQNGMVASITQFIAYLVIVEAGIGTVSIVALTKSLHADDKGKINSILAATQSFYSKAGGIFIVMVLILMFAYPHIVSGVDKLTAGLMVLILSAGAILDFFVVGKYRALLIADRKNYILGIFRIIAVVFNTVISVILIKSGNSFLFVKFISVLIYIFFCYSTILIYVKMRYKFLNTKEKFDKNTLKQKWDVMYHKFAAIVLESSPLIILTIFCSLKEVSIYSIYALVFFAVGQLIDTLSDGMQGFFGRSLAENNSERLKKIFGKYEFVYFSMVGVGYTCALLLTIPFMRIYTQNMTDANYIQPTLVVLFVIAGIMNKARIPASMFIIASGHFKQTKWRAIAEAVINISAGIFFVNKFGFSGILLGAIFGMAYRTFDMIIYSSKRIVNNSLLLTFGKILFLGLWYFAGYFILTNFVISDIESYLDFAISAGISLAFLAIPAIIYLFTSTLGKHIVFYRERI